MNETPTVSLLHATLGRPEKAIATMRLWAERAANPGAVEYVLAWEKDDTASSEHFDTVLQESDVPWFGEGVLAIRGAFGGSCPAWDACYRVSSGALLVQVSDDLECPDHWDIALLNRLPPMWETEKLVIAVNDGLRRDRLLCHAICTRTYADYRGEFLHKGYQSMFSDNEFSARAYIGASNGECKVIEARDLIFPHIHHCAHPDVPEDETYKFQNRPEAYEKGRELFNQRNPRAFGQLAHLWM